MGISYAVVTKVKDLSESRDYGEALDLLEGQDIYQSFNPQFLRCCGEVYLENERYEESRKALVTAHVMAPEATRVIYDLVYLYLKMGYFTRAKQYYDIYMFFAVSEDTGHYFLDYMIQKAQRTEAKFLLPILVRGCEEQYTDEWAFELALLYASLGNTEKSKEECVRMMATFKNSPYVDLAANLKKGEYDVTNSHFTFPIMEAQENPDADPATIAAEEAQLKKDMLKVHPPEAVILEEFEEPDTPEDANEGDSAEPKSKREARREAKEAKKEAKREAKAAKKVEAKVEQEDQAKADAAEAVDTSAKPDTESPSKDGAEDAPSGTKDTDALKLRLKADEMPTPTTDETPKSGEDETPTPSAEVTPELSGVDTPEPSTSDTPKEEVTASTVAQTESTPTPIKPKITSDSDMDVASFIAAVMGEVTEIEVSVQEDLEHPTTFLEKSGDTESKPVIAKEEYKPHLTQIEEALSPKERLAKLMNMIEQERREEQESKHADNPPDVREQIDMDEYLMNLVGANTITQAMVETYRNEESMARADEETV